MMVEDYEYQPPPHRLALIGNAVHTVDERRSDGGPGPDGQPETVNEQPGPDRALDDDSDVPAKSATKADWVEFAVARGASRDDAEAMTKDQLVEQYGA